MTRRPSTSPSSAAESSERWPRSNSPNRAPPWSCSSVAPSSAGAARQATPGSSGRAMSCLSPPRPPSGTACAGCCARTARSPCARGSPSSRGSRASSPPRRRSRSSARPTRCRPWPPAAQRCTRSSTARGSTPDTGEAGCSTSSAPSRRSPRLEPPLTEVRCWRRTKSRPWRRSSAATWPAASCITTKRTATPCASSWPSGRGRRNSGRASGRARRCSAYAARAGASAPWRRVTATCRSIRWSWRPGCGAAGSLASWTSRCRSRAARATTWTSRRSPAIPPSRSGCTSTASSSRRSVPACASPGRSSSREPTSASITAASTRSFRPRPAPYPRSPGGPACTSGAVCGRARPTGCR